MTYLSNLQRRLDIAMAGVISDGIRRDLVSEVGKVEAQRALVPELITALKAVEWVNRGGDYCRCPWCMRTNLEGDGHAANCPRQAILQKAGVL